LIVPLQFAILGLGAGALYGLQALGMVLAYRGSGVINFASGAVGMAGTFMFYELHDEHGWGFAAAVIPSLLFCAAIGVVIQMLVTRPLRRSSGLTKLLATLGVLMTLEGAASLWFQAQTYIVTSSLPQSSVRILGATVGKDRIFIFVIVLVLSGVLYTLYKYSLFGIVTSGVAENPLARKGHLPGRDGISFEIGVPGERLHLDS
jgi:branched-subunit amino acid ABC-type transport system permease component